MFADVSGIYTFGMTTGYGLSYAAISRQKIIRILSGAFVLLWTVGYFGNSGTFLVWDAGRFRVSGTDATTFLEQDSSQDASAIRWLKQNIKGLSCGARG